MKKKMNLKNLKVNSFVTDLDSNSSETVKGGFDPTNTRPTGPCGGCDILTDQSCGGGGGGWNPSDGCSNNSCAECYVF